MPSRSRSLMRSCGSKPPLRPSVYFMSSGARPSRRPMAPRRPRPRGPPMIVPSMFKRSLPSVSTNMRGARARNLGSMYLSQRSTGSRMWPSASITLYSRPMARLLVAVHSGSSYGMEGVPCQGAGHAVELSTVQRAPERLPRQGSGVLPMIQQHLPMDDDIIHPHSPLLHVHFPAGKGVHGLPWFGGNGVWVEDGDICHLAWREKAPIMQVVHQGRLARHAVDSVF